MRFLMSYWPENINWCQWQCTTPPPEPFLAYRFPNLQHRPPFASSWWDCTLLPKRLVSVHSASSSRVLPPLPSPVPTDPAHTHTHTSLSTALSAHRYSSTNLWRQMKYWLLCVCVCACPYVFVCTLSCRWAVCAFSSLISVVILHSRFSIMAILQCGCLWSVCVCFSCVNMKASLTCWCVRMMCDRLPLIRKKFGSGRGFASRQCCRLFCYIYDYFFSSSSFLAREISDNC